MNDKFSIKRYPNHAGLMRGVNMMTKLCQNCLEDKTHGFSFYEGEENGRVLLSSMFVCDDCLTAAKKEVTKK